MFILIYIRTKVTLMENLVKSSFFTSPDTQEVLTGNDLDFNNLVYKYIFDYQIYNNIPEMEIKKDDVVLDVGAHIGIFCRYSATKEASRVIGFEMNPKHFSCLRKNVRPQDDVFNCVLFDKNLSKYKLDNNVLVNGFDLNHFYTGKLFDKIDFMKMDVSSGNEITFLSSISKNIYDCIQKISIKCYDISNDDKLCLNNFMKLSGFHNNHNMVMVESIEFLYFWK